jgi:ADP-ribosylation factor 1/2
MMRGAAILVFANKQDGPGALTPAEVCECLGLPELRGRRWHVQSAVATRGEGLYEGLDWLSQQVSSSRPAA